MPREANAVDFWRGFALITIFINHIPGISFERFTHRNVSISDSAELFVFLAGWGLALMVARFEAQGQRIEALKRMASRALSLYAAHLMIISLAIAMLAAAATAYDNPLLLEWHNAATVFNDPIRAHIGLVTLTYQLGYFDILPLYVVLTAAAPLIVALAWVDRRLLLAASIGIYVLALVTRYSLPSWPVEGQWFFNPLAWQLIFVLGYLVARDEGLGAFARRHWSVLQVVAWPIVIASAVMMVFDLKPDPTRLPEPKLLFADVKSFQTPVRLIQFLSLVVVVSSVHGAIFVRLPTVFAVLAKLGRHSLPVFCVGSILSLASQIARFVYKGSFALDCAILIVGVSMLMLTAWLAEWPRSAKRMDAASRSSVR